MASKKIGRPTKLTKETLEELLNYIRLGMPIESACGLAGIARSTYYNWKDKATPDEDGKLPPGSAEFVDFLDTLKKVEDEAKARLLERINAKTNPWQASAWILERRWPKEFGAKLPMLPSGDDDDEEDYGILFRVVKPEKKKPAATRKSAGNKRAKKK